MTEITENILIEHGFTQINELAFENDLFIIEHKFYPKHGIIPGWVIYLKNNIQSYLLPRHIQYFEQLQSLYLLFTQKEL